MLFAIGFLFLFTLGGFTGLVLVDHAGRRPGRRTPTTSSPTSTT